MTASATAAEALIQWVYHTRVLEGARAESADAARRIRSPASSAYRVLVHTPHEYHLEEEVEGTVYNQHNLNLKAFTHQEISL